MRWRNTKANWGAVAKFFHWVIALAVIGNIALGLYADGLPTSPAEADAFYWHKTIGLTVLGLAGLRILWRWSNPVPDLPLGTPTWRRIAAAISHFCLYLVILAMPLSGWLMHSASGSSLELYGLFEVPSILPAAMDAERAQELAHQAHYWLFITICALVGVHVVAALEHHIRGDKILVRMLPFRRASDPIRGE